MEVQTNDATAKRKQKKFDVLFFGDDIRTIQNIPVKIRTAVYANLTQISEIDFVLPLPLDKMSAWQIAMLKPTMK